MGLIAGQIYKEMTQALRGPGSANLSMQDVANDMGEYLCSMRSWRWKEPRPFYFDLRGIIEDSTCDWTDSTKLLVPSTGDPFADYVHLVGDRVLINSGTGLATGITGKRVSVTGTSGSGPVSLVLDEDISAAGDISSSDINVTLRLDTFDVDETIKEVLKLEVTDGLFNGITMVDQATMLHKRTSALETTSPWEYFVCFSWPEDANGIPRPVGEVWPAPQGDSVQGFTAWAKTGWVYLSTDTSSVRVPDWLYRLYKNLCREAWMGLHNHEGVGFDQRIAMVSESHTYQIARQRDASFQVEAGPISNGHADMAGRNFSLFNNDSLSGGPV